MQRLAGSLLILVGATLAAYSYLSPRHDGTATLADVSPQTFIPTFEPREDDAGVRSFSPTSPAFRERTPIASAAQSLEPVVALKPWTAVVSMEPASSRLKSSRPGDFATRVEITRDLQRELKRVGCYAGEITGNWSAGSRAAMADFMDRVNATLPVDEPDYILLTLVQGHGGIACGAQCPAGQVMSQANRCVPRAVLAQRTPKTKQPVLQRVAAMQPRSASASKQSIESDVTLPAFVKPNAATFKGSAPDARAKAKPTIFASTQPEMLPWLENRIAMAAPAARAEPLAGRMAIGGPIAAVTRTNALAGAQKVEWEPIPADDLSASATTSIPKALALLSPADGAGNGDGDDVSKPETRISDHAVDRPHKVHKKASRSRNSKYARRPFPQFAPRPYYYAENVRYRRAYYYAPIRYNLTLSTRGIF